MSDKKTKCFRWIYLALFVCGFTAVNILNVAAQELLQSTSVEQGKSAFVASNQDVQWLTSKLKAPKQLDGSITVNASDVEKFEALLIKTIKLNPKAGGFVTDLADQWAELHWKLEFSPSQSFFTIGETVDHQHGRGVYAFRINAETPIAIQAPHRFYDQMTGTIAKKLFFEHPVTSIALNTAHRKEIDLSHTKVHYLNAFTSAIIKAKHDVAIVQLHGFTNSGKSGAAKFAQAIVSDTTKFPGRSARQTALELKTDFGQDQTRLFPVDIKQLGGTTNRQAEVAHNLGCPNFLHVELNHEFRSQLKKDASIRNSFYASILRGVAK